MKNSHVFNTLVEAYINLQRYCFDSRHDASGFLHSFKHGCTLLYNLFRKVALAKAEDWYIRRNRRKESLNKMLTLTTGVSHVSGPTPHAVAVGDRYAVRAWYCPQESQAERSEKDISYLP